MDVVFKGRNFVDKMPVPVPVAVEKYSWNMIGGPEYATLTAPATADKWELMKLLRAPVEIYGDDGGLKWYGFVNRVTVPNGEQLIGLGLDNMFNYVEVTYSAESTASPTTDLDQMSIDLYGRKEHKINDPNGDSTWATNVSSLYLQEHKYPRDELELSGGQDTVKIECYGWYNTLSWRFYSDADTTANTENTTQISDIVTSVGEFFAGTIIENTAGITSAEGRDGSQTAQACINELLNAGTSNVRPLLAYVDSARFLHVYERPVEPSDTFYIFRQDGSLENKLGAYVQDQDCKVAVWVRVKQTPNSVGGYSSMRPFFIQRSEYDRKKNKTKYYPADAYEQRRLAKYIERVMGGTGGGGTPWIPTQPDAVPLRLGFGIYLVNSDTITGTDSIEAASTLAERTRYDFTFTLAGGGYSTIKFAKKGVYYLGASLLISGNDAGPDTFLANLLNQSDYCRIYGYNTVDPSDQAESSLNLGGLVYVRDADSGQHPRIGLTYAFLTLTEYTTQSTEWTMSGWFMVARLGD